MLAFSSSSVELAWTKFLKILSIHYNSTMGKVPSQRSMDGEDSNGRWRCLRRFDEALMIDFVNDKAQVSNHDMNNDNDDATVSNISKGSWQCSI